MKKALKAMLGLTGIVAVIVGVPWLLITTVGWPLPDHVPDLDEVRRVVSQRDFGTSFLLGTLAIICWVLWAQVVWATVWELAVNVGRVRHRQTPRPAPLVAAPIGRLVAVAIMSVLALMARPTTGTALGPSDLAVHHATVTSISASTAVGDDHDVARMASPQSEATSSVKDQFWTARPGDTLWDIAETALGDGARVDEIVQLNPSIEVGDQVATGTKIRLPDNIVRAQSEVVVEKGDTLWGLTESQWGDTDMERIGEVAERNEIDDPHLIYPGDVVDIAEPGALNTASDDADQTDSDASRSTFEVELNSAVVDLPQPEVPAAPVDSDLPQPVSADAVQRQQDAQQGGVASDANHPEEKGSLLPVQLSVTLSAGLLGLLALRRRTWWQSMLPWVQPSDDAQSLERSLAAAPAEEHVPPWSQDRLAAIWTVVSRAASPSSARLLAVINRGTRGLTAHFGTEVELPEPYCGGGRVWSLALDEVDLLDIDGSSAPDPDGETAASMARTIVQLGVEEDDAPIYVDLQAIHTLEVGGPENAAESIVAALEWGAGTVVDPPLPHLVSVGLSDVRHAPNVQTLEVNRFSDAEDRVQLIGGLGRQPTIDTRRMNGQRPRGAVVLVGPAIRDVRPFGLASAALVSASPIHGPSHTLVPDGEFWSLRPMGLRVRPIGIDRSEAELLAELFGPTPQHEGQSDNDPSTEDGPSGVGDDDYWVLGPDAVPSGDLTSGAHDGTAQHDTASNATALARLDALDRPVAGMSDLESPVNGVHTLTEPDNSNATLAVIGADTHPDPAPDADITVPPPDAEERSDDDQSMVRARRSISGSAASRARSAQRVRPVEHDDATVIVRLMGPAAVEGGEGQSVPFRDPKQLELMVWLSVHRETPTRTDARGALWNFEIGENQFNRVLAGLGYTLHDALGDGVDWIGDSSTELVAVHPGVRTDAEDVVRALDWARQLDPDRRVEVLSGLTSEIRGMPLENMPFGWAHSDGLVHRLIEVGSTVFIELSRACTELGACVDAQDAAEEGLAIYPGHQLLFELAFRAAAERGDVSEVDRIFRDYGGGLTASARRRFEEMVDGVLQTSVGESVTSKGRVGSGRPS